MYLLVMGIAILVGATASGKTSLSIEAAKRAGAEIVSCDSLTVYRDLNIGTAKPTHAERGLVPHHGIDLISTDSPFTAADYVREVRPVIDRLVSKGTPVLITGGTGFYLKALVFGTWDAPPANAAIRAKFEETSSEALHGLLTSKDATAASKIALNDRYRVIRALEIIEQTGKTVTEVLASAKLQNPLPYPVQTFGILRDKTELETRIITRTEAMLKDGLIEETKAVLARYPAARPRCLGSVGYKEACAYLDGKISLDGCRSAIELATRQLAKRQMTFFKGMGLPIEWFSLPAQEAELKNRLVKSLETNQ